MTSLPARMTVGIEPSLPVQRHCFNALIPVGHKTGQNCKPHKSTCQPNLFSMAFHDLLQSVFVTFQDCVCKCYFGKTANLKSVATNNSPVQVHCLNALSSVGHKTGGQYFKPHKSERSVSSPAAAVSVSLPPVLCS